MSSPRENKYRKVVPPMKQRSSAFDMTAKQAEFLLAAVIIARSTSYLFSKICLQTMGAFTLLSIRSLLAFAVLAVLFRKRLCGISKSALRHGMLLGGTFFAVMAAELYGLRTTPTSTTSFLENTAIVLVPLLEAALHRKAPRPLALLSDGITLLGIGFLTLGAGGGVALKAGELFCLLAAALYAVAIILTDRLSRREDPLTLGILQIGFMGLFSLCAAFLLETPSLPASSAAWGSILYLALICSGFGFTLQPLAQRHTSSEKAGIFCALNPLTATVLGITVLREPFTLSAGVGAVLILSGILIARATPAAAKKKPAAA